MLPLCTWHAWGLDCPLIFPHDVLVARGHHYNRFNSESHAWFHLSFRCCARLVVVDHGRHMHVMSDSMASKIFINCKTVCLCVIPTFNLDKRFTYWMTSPILLYLTPGLQISIAVYIASRVTLLYNIVSHNKLITSFYMSGCTSPKRTIPELSPWCPL